MEAYRKWCVLSGQHALQPNLGNNILWHADTYEDHTIPFQNKILEINHTVIIDRNATPQLVQNLTTSTLILPGFEDFFLPCFKQFP
jgi:hypothetical protein